MPKKIISIDQGTTSTRAVLFDKKCKFINFEQMEHKQHFPADGWVEHNPEEIWKSVVKVTDKLIKKNSLKPSDIAAIGITNQRETTILWDRKTGKPIYPAIVWQDRRTSEFCDVLKKEKGLEEEIQEKTGLLIDPYFSATKLAWILDNVDGARKKAEKGELAFGTIDSFLIWRLTEGKCHKTDATNASRTMLFDIKSYCWDSDLLRLLNIPEQILPEVCDCTHDYGETSLFGGKLKIGGIAGDQQAALVGQCCFNPGEAKSTFGTGCFLLLNTGSEKLSSTNKLLSTIAYRINGKTTYGLEGSIFVAGSAVQWLRDGLKLFKTARDTEEIVKVRHSDSKVLVVPAFTGLGAPHWDPSARGSVFGLTRDTNIADLTAATLESIAFQTKDLIGAMKNDGASFSELRVDGGMVANNWFSQQLSNVLGLTVLRPRVIETTALGAAYLASLNSGLCPDLDSLKSNWSCDKTFEPEEKKVALLNTKYETWLSAVDRTKGLF
ncbi:MAG: glycerol kinase GlpK [SAR86 cluster bacterium]|jgi:glycerol kinase|nr:glycerol kinase GlpK [SAR86 cluster bacterium]